MRVIISPLGLQDLAEIIDYIAADNPIAALRLVDDLEAFCNTVIVSNPKIGKPADGLVRGLRVVTKHNYRICYRISGQTIEIARFVHGARELDALFSR